MNDRVDKILKQALIRRQEIAFSEVSDQILLRGRMVSKMKIYPTSFKLYAMGLHIKYLKHIRVLTTKVNEFARVLNKKKITPN